ncbi:MAG TPA: riboflavin synthase [Phycisphaerales bacterium]|nr:riboflavin synthase [Phycisphaerales bacterium]
MFTGLIEATGVVRSPARAAGATAALTVDLGSIAGECRVGDSIAVNGVCLTIAGIEAGNVCFDLSRETLERSSLARLRAGGKVNIERALPATARLGGHIVQGHIDGTARIAAIDRRDHYADIRFSADRRLLSQMVEKGSVAVDGISLTVAALDHESFTVAVIPETLARTTLANTRAGDLVNIETDIVVKAVHKYLDNVLPSETGLTVEKLKQMGF